MTRLADLPTQLRAAGLPAARAEYAFDPSRKWRFDYAFPSVKVAVEVDGGTYVGGRHVTGSGYAKDLEKLNTALVQGWRILRVTPAMVEDGTALGWLETLLRSVR